jgi:hypothetical protein
MRCVWLITGGLAALAAAGHADGVRPPLRVEGGDPLCAIYFFPHWWEPWKSDDDAIRRDLGLLKSKGINTLLVDHEWSQAIDRDWFLLDRGHRLAREAGMGIVPWLSLKTWSDMASDPARIRLIKQQYGVDLVLGCDQDGRPSTPLVYDEATIEAGYRYTKAYLDRYLASGAIARVLWEGKARPVVALTVELAWAQGSFDDRTNALFRGWLTKRYGSVEALNTAWGTTLADMESVQPRDKAILDYEGHMAGKASHPVAVEDHVEFRSQMVNEGLAKIKERVLDDYPDVLIATELPYQIASEHPHAVSYRIEYGSTPSSARHAEILFLRMTGPLNAAEAKALDDYLAETGQRAVLCYRTYSDWRISPDQPARDEIPGIYARGAAEHANGIGFYSWNECVDVHLSAPGPGSPDNPMTVRPPVSDQMQAFAWRVVELYREMVRQGVR